MARDVALSDLIVGRLDLVVFDVWLFDSLLHVAFVLFYTKIASTMVVLSSLTQSAVVLEVNRVDVLFVV